jgi:hypothetical protein
MDAVLDSLIFITTLGASFGTALILQKAALRLVLKAIDTK